jgi:hypothetical protein
MSAPGHSLPLIAQSKHPLLTRQKTWQRQLVVSPCELWLMSAFVYERLEHSQKCANEQFEPIPSVTCPARWAMSGHPLHHCSPPATLTLFPPQRYPSGPSPGVQPRHTRPSLTLFDRQASDGLRFCDCGATTCTVFFFATPKIALHLR